MSPNTKIGLVTSVAAAVTPPLVDVHVMVKLRIGLSPGLPAVNDTVADCAAITAVPIVGGPGTPGIADTTNEFDGADAGPCPTAFVPYTVHVYVLPLVRFSTTIGLEAPVKIPKLVPPSLEVHDA